MSDSGSALRAAFSAVRRDRLTWRHSSNQADDWRRRQVTQRTGTGLSSNWVAVTSYNMARPSASRPCQCCSLHREDDSRSVVKVSRSNNRHDLRDVDVYVGNSRRRCDDQHNRRWSIVCHWHTCKSSLMPAGLGLANTVGTLQTHPHSQVGSGQQVWVWPTLLQHSRHVHTHRWAVAIRYNTIQYT